ncbi:hypothetical protein PR048_003516 [Dryococelus australis]|uniref:Uncharacterized protein n=1 Tax=Dryococelus australis TaxID=614101 RepID=A0ABQ9IN95_9NEOP|nr:hypothetical protein PR048_003516 [Dryococelus australis]
MEQHRNEGAGETGDPRVNPPSQRHRQGRFPLVKIRLPGRGLNAVRLELAAGKTCEHPSSAKDAGSTAKRRSGPSAFTETAKEHTSELLRQTRETHLIHLFAEHARLPPRRTVFDTRPGHQTFANGNLAGRCRWSAGPLGDLPLIPPPHSGAALRSLPSASSALKTTLAVKHSLTLLLPAHHWLTIKRGVSKELSSNHNSRGKEQVFGVYLASELIREILVALIIRQQEVYRHPRPLTQTCDWASFLIDYSLLHNIPQYGLGFLLEGKFLKVHSQSSVASVSRPSHQAVTFVMDESQSGAKALAVLHDGQASQKNGLCDIGMRLGWSRGEMKTEEKRVHSRRVGELHVNVQSWYGFPRPYVMHFRHTRVQQGTSSCGAKQFIERGNDGLVPLLETYEIRFILRREDRQTPLAYTQARRFRGFTARCTLIDANYLLDLL